MAPRDSTAIGGKGNAFPSTSWALVRAAADPDSPEARAKLGALLSLYWKPVYHYVRALWRKSNEDAKDLTQGFFARLLESGDLSRAAREHGSLRSYLKAALAHYLVDERRRDRALKRGAGAVRLPADVSDLEEDLPDPASATPEEIFDRAWISACFSEAVERLEEGLRAEGREVYFRAFHLYYLEPAGPPTYESVGAALGLRATDVANHLFYVRQRLRGLLRERVSRTTASEGDAAGEMGFILGDGS